MAFLLRRDPGRGPRLIKPWCVLVVVAYCLPLPIVSGVCCWGGGGWTGLCGAVRLCADTTATLPKGVVATKPTNGPTVAVAGGFMVPYAQIIPGTDVAIEMVPIPGGQFLLGSPEDEAGREAGEGPQATILIEPFWIGRYEVTWSEYHVFMDLYESFKKFDQLRLDKQLFAPTPEESEFDNGARALWNHLRHVPTLVDAITSPTPLYEPEVTYESGRDPRQPAVTMTPYAARQFTRWLSGITGNDYRLPNEAEWEYAARAGTVTPYHFGHDPDKLGEYDWYEDNADGVTHVVGQKKPNPWGLYDVHGNVAEIVIDDFHPRAYAKWQTRTWPSRETVEIPQQAYPRVVRGGHWAADASRCRAAVRFGTDDEEWKISDPNLPLSPWWYTEQDPAGAVGFRLLRPARHMDAEERRIYWEHVPPSLLGDVEIRLEEGRGAMGRAKPSLPQAIGELDSPRVRRVLMPRR